jgi:DNA repair ATPase RecN
MAEAQLKAELSALQAKMRAEEQLKREMSDLHAELRVLREQVDAGRPTAPKDMSIV